MFSTFFDFWSSELLFGWGTEFKIDRGNSEYTVDLGAEDKVDLWLSIEKGGSYTTDSDATGGAWIAIPENLVGIDTLGVGLYLEIRFLIYKILKFQINRKFKRKLTCEKSHYGYCICLHNLMQMLDFYFAAGTLLCRIVFF